MATSTRPRHPRHARKAIKTDPSVEETGVRTTGLLRAFEALADKEQEVEDLQTWLSYLYMMRRNVMSALFWGKFEKFMESRGLELWDVSFDDLPQS